MGKKKDIKTKIKIVFNAEVILRDGIKAKDLLMKETDFLAEPQSTNGCVTELKIESVEEI